MTNLNRRDFLKITAVASGVVLGGAALRRALAAGKYSVHETRSLMGTVINLTLVTEDEQQGRAALENTFAEMGRLVAIFNHRQDDSPLALLNRQGVLDDPPAELRQVIGSALQISQLSQGAFDISIKPLLDAYQAGRTPTEAERVLVDYQQIVLSDERIGLAVPGMALTLDAIAKGYVVDGGVSVLQSFGFEDIMVEAGGDLLASGLNDSGQPWNVAVLDPRQAEDQHYLTTFPLSTAAAATSGDYMNSFSSDHSLHHIIDPRTALSPPELASATVIAPSAMRADALSTTLMVLGPEAGLALVESLPGVEALIASKTLAVQSSSGFPSVIA